MKYVPLRIMAWLIIVVGMVMAAVEIAQGVPIMDDWNNENLSMLFYFNENDETLELNDSASNPNNHNGTLNNPTDFEYKPGVTGNAGDFSGMYGAINGYHELDNPTDIDDFSYFESSFAINGSDLGGGEDHILQAAGNNLFIRYNTGRIKFFINVGGTDCSIDWFEYSSFLTSNQWNNITVSYNGTHCSVWDDTVLQESQAASGNLAVSATSLRLGDSASSTNAALDCFAIWDNATLSTTARRDFFDTCYAQGGAPPSDTTPPTWSGNNVNDTTPVVNTDVRFNVTLADETALDTYIFSWNDSGSFVNDSSIDISGTSYIANVSKTVSAAADSVVCGQFFFNDTSNNQNNTNMSCVTVQAAPAAPFWEINQSFNLSNETSLTFTFNSTGINETLLVRARLWDVDGNLVVSENRTITVNASASECDCPSGEDWNVPNCNCLINTDCSLPDYNLILGDAAGTFEISNAAVEVASVIKEGTDCDIAFTKSGGSLAIKK